MKTQAVVLGMIFAVVSIAATPAYAMIVGEGVTALRCADSDPVPIPKKLIFGQTLLSDHLEGYTMMGLVLDAAYDDEDVNRGKVTARLTQIKPDGSEISRGKVSGKIREGETNKVKIVDGTLEQGDVLEWKVTLKKMPPVEAANGEIGCWNLMVTVAVADEIPDQ